MKTGNITAAILIGIILVLSLAQKTHASDNTTPQNILNNYYFAERVDFEYTDDMPTFVRARVTTHKVAGQLNTYTIMLEPVPFDDEQKGLFLHELSHIICTEVNVNLDEYMVFVHTYESYGGESWSSSLRECFAEDGKVYMMNRLFGLQSENDTKYSYNTRFGWYMRLKGYDIWR